MLSDALRHTLNVTERVCRNCGGVVKGTTHAGNPRKVCGRSECRAVPRVPPPKYRYEQEMLARAKQEVEALDRPLRTLADRQALADEIEPVVIAQLKELARLGDTSAAKALLDFASRMLDRAADDDADWLANSPSEATDSR